MSAIFKRVSKAFRATSSDMRTSHWWWPLFGLVVIAIPLIGWISYDTDQILADSELESQLRLEQQETDLLNERGLDRKELMPTLRDYCRDHEEALADSLADDAAVQRLLVTYERVPEIKEEVQAAKNSLIGLTFSGRTAALLAARRDAELALLEIYEIQLREDEEQLQVLMTQGITGLIRYRDDGRLAAAEAQLSEKFKRTENQLDSAMLLHASTHGAIARERERHEVESQRRRSWVVLAEGSIIYLICIAIAISVKFVRNLKRNDEKLVTTSRKKRPSSAKVSRRRKQ